MGDDDPLRMPRLDQAQPRTWLVGQQHVLRDSQIGDQRQFLERGLHARLVGLPRRADPPGLAENLDKAGIGLHEAAQQLDEGRLARPVLAEQRMHASRPHRKADVRDGDGWSVRFAHALHGDRRRGAHGSGVE